MITTGKILPTLVVGGGIGGLAAALAIARAGREVHLIEQAPEFTEIGAGLQVGPNATRMLDRLGVLKQALDIAVLPTRGVMMDAVTGEQLTVLDLGEAFRDRYSYPYVVLHRGDLLDILLAACAENPLVRLENDKTVVDVWSEDDLAGVSCGDGSSYTTELLVGADGINSRVRQLFDTSPPHHSGYVAYRGTLPIGEVTSEVSTDDVVLWIGPGMHLMQYPVRRSEIYNQVAVISTGQPVSADQPGGSPEQFRERFGRACDQVQRHVARISTERRWPIFDRDPLDTWISGRAVLLGDAAHAMLQFLGQGSCQALEDAVTLAEQVSAGPSDLPAALAAYQDLRMDRTTRCQLSARPWGELWHTADPTVRALRDRVLRMRAADDYSEVDWLYLDQFEAS